MLKIFAATVLSFIAIAALGQDTKIDITVRGAENQPVILGYYFNKQLLVKDTIMLDSKGSTTYAPPTKAEEGMYVLYFPNKSYLDFVIGSDQQFTLSTSQTDMLDNTSIVGSNESQQFLDYQKFISIKQKEFASLQKQHGESEEGKAIIQQGYDKINKEVAKYSGALINNNRGSFLALFLNGLREVELPDFKSLQPSLSDSLARQKQYYYYRAHFFDNIDLSDSRMLRTPYFTSKIDTYFNETVPQIPDTIAAEAVKFIEKTRGDKEMFKYVVSYLYNLTNESKIMGMDAALIAIAERYYLTGDAFWAEQKFIDELRVTVNKLKPILVGKTAPDLKMASFNQQYYRLHEVSSPFTILVFWETDCGHCQKEIPELHNIWKTSLTKDVKVFCVYTHSKTDEWIKFVEEHQMDDWINVYDPRNTTGFRNTYNINSTPQIFILDKDKKILAKKIEVAQIAEVISYLRNNKI